jgi:hypothetical protein
LFDSRFIESVVTLALVIEIFSHCEPFFLVDFLGRDKYWRESRGTIDERRKKICLRGSQARMRAGGVECRKRELPLS